MKGLLLASATFFFFLLWVAGAAPAGLRPSWAGRWRSFNFRHWARTLVRILVVRLEVGGRPPPPPALLVANHLSYLDVVLLASRVDAVFVAKSEVEGWPVVGTLCRAMDTIFVDRGSRRDLPRVVSRIEGVLDGGRSVILFPEGTSTPGETIGRFRSPLLAAAAAADLPVWWAVLRYATPPEEAPAAESVCWWGDMELLPHLWGLLALTRIDAELVFGGEPVVDRDRKLLARRLRAAMVERFVPTPTTADRVRWAGLASG